MHVWDNEKWGMCLVIETPGFYRYKQISSGQIRKCRQELKKAGISDIPALKRRVL